jgi:hypothetical protein
MTLGCLNALTAEQLGDFRQRDAVFWGSTAKVSLNRWLIMLPPAVILSFSKQRAKIFLPMAYRRPSFTLPDTKDISWIAVKHGKQLLRRIGRDEYRNVSAGLLSGGDDAGSPANMGSDSSRV